MAQVAFDKQDQLEKIQAGLMEGETLFAVYDGKGMGGAARLKLWG